MVSAKKTPRKTVKSAIEARNSASKAIKNDSTPSPVKGLSSSKAKTAFTHHLPSEQQRKKNGRVTGRSLIVWNRPRMAEKLLLHIQYECQRAKVDLPWAAIAHRLHPGSSGPAVQQHLTRLRRDLIAEGHMVPPMPQTRNASPVPSDVRGFIRKDLDGDDKLTTRPVKFSEEIEDRRFNLPDAGDLLDDEDVADEDVAVPDSPTPIRRGAARAQSRPYYSGTASPTEYEGLSQPNFYGYDIHGKPLQGRGKGAPASSGSEDEKIYAKPNSRTSTSSEESVSPAPAGDNLNLFTNPNPFITPHRPNQDLAQALATPYISPASYVSPTSSDNYASVPVSPTNVGTTLGHPSFYQWPLFQSVPPPSGPNPNMTADDAQMFASFINEDEFVRGGSNFDDVFYPHGEASI